MILLVAVFGLLVVALLVYLSFKPSFPIFSVSHGPRQQKNIALTFDDGPNPAVTEAVLQILKQHDVRATFFIVGKNAKANPELMKKIASDHLIANHSTSHNYMAAPARAVLKDLQATNQTIEKLTGHLPAFYRPPYGLRTFWSGSSITKSGLTTVTWDNMTRDYFGMTAAKLITNIVKRARPGGIIVLHDGREGNARGVSHVAEALPEIIKQLRAKGYKIVSLDELLGQPGYITKDTGNA